MCERNQPLSQNKGRPKHRAAGQPQGGDLKETQRDAGLWPNLRALRGQGRGTSEPPPLSLPGVRESHVLSDAPTRPVQAGRHPLAA